MSKAIQVVVFPDPERWLRENGPALTGDNICAVRPKGPFNPDGLTTYVDTSDERPNLDISEKKCTLADHVTALQKLCEQVAVTLFVGGVKSPLELCDPGNWDVEVVDAYWQLLFYGEVIYG